MLSAPVGEMVVMMMIMTAVSLILGMALFKVGLVRFMAMVTVDDMRRDVTMEEIGDEAQAHRSDDEETYERVCGCRFRPTGTD